jgi:hypothetical protein
MCGGWRPCARSRLPEAPAGCANKRIGNILKKAEGRPA